MHRSIFKRTLRVGVGLTAIGAALIAAPAIAQETTSAPPAAQEPPAQQIVVTGSRIARRDYEANSPLVTVSPDSFANRQSVTVEATLNELPQFTPAGSSSISSTAGTAFTGADQAPGAATLDLRGLGANRTLVLINGRRAQPVNAQMIVDVNTIPSAAIKNVEVITGGAAAVYGADAIAGVVNFILRDDFEGLELDAQYGLAEVGDNKTAQISGLIGGNFADGKGNAMLGISWSDRGRAWQKNRDFYTDGWNDPNTSGAGGGLPVTEAVINGLTYGVNFDGSLFNPNDAANPLAPFKGTLHGLTGGSGFKLNPAIPGSTQQSLGYNDPAALVNIPLTRYSLYGAAHYDITDDIQAFIEGNFTHSSAFTQSFSGTAGNIWALNVPYNQANDDPASPTFGADPTNFYPVSGPLANLLNTNGLSSWSLNRGLNFLGNLFIRTNSDIYQFTAGFRGKFGIKDWTWEIYGSHGNTSVVARQPQGAVSYDNLKQVLSGQNSNGVRSNTINGAWSAGWTSGATFNPNSCTSGIPIFNANGSVPQPLGGNTEEGVALSQDCKDYLTLELNNVTTVQQNIVEATTQGALFNNWAGEIRFSLGATYRDEKFSYNPDTGVSGQQASTGVVNQIALPDPTKGKINTKEIYGELLIPLLKDVPLVKQFDLELGGRYSDYSLSGSVGTYKALADWRVTPWLRLRGGYQLANRAPNIYELFAPIAGGLGASNDPCENITGYTPSFGNVPTNPNLINLQAACKALIVRDGGYAYGTIGENAGNVAQDPALYYTGQIDQTRMSNFRYGIAYNLAFPYSIALSQGNTNLKSEKAHTITAGAVLNSPFQTALLNRLTLTVDYYYINLKDTIGQPSGTEIYTQCLSPQYNPLMGAAAGTYTGAQLIEGNPYCGLVNRYPYDLFGTLGAPGSGADRTYDAPFLNQGATKTAGLDITANWTVRFDDLGAKSVPGALNFNLSANVLFKYKEQAFSGGPDIDVKGTLETNAYNYKLFGTVTYLWGTGSVGLRGRHLPSIKASPFAAEGTAGAGAYTEFDLFGSYQITPRVDLRVGVDNLFDVSPPVVGATATNAAQGTTLPIYDSIGRAYYLGVHVKM